MSTAQWWKNRREFGEQGVDKPAASVCVKGGYAAMVATKGKKRREEMKEKGRGGCEQGGTL
jgi:hypothetical protein